MLKLKKKKRQRADEPVKEKECVCRRDEVHKFMVQCSGPKDHCPNQWWHLECAGLSGIAPSSLKKVTYLCPACIINRNEAEFELTIQVMPTDQIGIEIEKHISKSVPKIVNELKQVIEKSGPSNDCLKADMKKSFAEVVKEQTKVKQSSIPLTKNIVKQALKEEKNEQDKLEKRKRSLVVFDAEEASQDEWQAAKNDDNKLFETICDKVDSRILEDQDEVVDIKRIGKKVEGKKRPLLVTMKTEKSKRLLFGNLYKLKDNEELQHMKFAHDMTEEERKTRKEKVKEAKEKTAELQNDTSISDDAKNWRFVIRGPPWEQRLVKIRPALHHYQQT